VLCAVIGLGAELGGREASGRSRGGDALGATVWGLGEQRAVARLCDSGGVDGVTSTGETCGARGRAAQAAPGAGRRAAALLGECLGRSGVVCPVVVPAHGALGLASGVTDQYGRDVSSCDQRSLSAPAGASSAARHHSGSARGRPFRDRAAGSIARGAPAGTRGPLLPGYYGLTWRPVRARRVGMAYGQGASKALKSPNGGAGNGRARACATRSGRRGGG
jgi:hypothetical protein